ncbi:uroporphyrinogen decarboxylase [Pseudanabaena galeata UHCC 0370]|uniref:Uroporphyrinogen decarboxylase n=1 Tax=Pseudanabaena galeata UHCC 0370 TaxID=3110310 RepID=A0ABU5TRK1_9CYAN|nr:uroporphyrinogen decarboxylase [Pseudanabaena galeata]MEA5480681.1 uroporphyrinogen decarboxylase [Pseudanabaena galeata UHCC 0370]
MGGNDRLLRAARGEVLDRPPVWMMRQAGRYMKVYRDLRDKYPTFRERSEIPELAAEISLQPFRAFQPDGVIMFSDILTPLTGIGINFDIIESRGPIIESPIRTQAQVDALTEFDPDTAVPFIRKILSAIKEEVKDQATILGFVGAPWTLAAYSVEGKGSKDYSTIKAMAYKEPAIIHSFLTKIAEMIGTYVIHQIECGAQVVQMFDSWAGHLCPTDYKTFALPYQKMVVDKVKAKYPDTPLILYISGSAGVLDLMPKSGVDIVSVDWTVDLADARDLLGHDIPVQGNLDPCVLFAEQSYIRERILEVVAKAGNKGHIMNLGHGILSTTPEDNARFFFETVKGLGS